MARTVLARLSCPEFFFPSHAAFTTASPWHVQDHFFFPQGRMTPRQEFLFLFFELSSPPSEPCPRFENDRRPPFDSIMCSIERTPNKVSFPLTSFFFRSRSPATPPRQKDGVQRDRSTNDPDTRADVPRILLLVPSRPKQDQEGFPLCVFLGRRRSGRGLLTVDKKNKTVLLFPLPYNSEIFLSGTCVLSAYGRRLK